MVGRVRELMEGIGDRGKGEGIKGRNRGDGRKGKGSKGRNKGWAL